MTSIGQIAPGINSEVLVYLAGTHTWTKPAWARFVHVQITAGGGAGASGRRGAALTARCGGGGGGGGGQSERLFRASELPASTTVTVHANNAGGAANTVDDTDGTLGTGLSISWFGPASASALLMAGSGSRGTGGGVAATSGGGGAGHGDTTGEIGATGTTGAGTAKIFATGTPSRGGGGGGGMLAADNVENVGGTGFWPTSLYNRTAVANGGAIRAAGGPGVATGMVGQPGASGGGGGSGHTGASGAGGDGTAFGGGGGGGGASTNGQVAGKGGDGGPSVIIITSYA